jgi:TolB-like protein
LDSWKEIASYLGRSEKTVRRWEEREELPVHRLLHEKRGSVYAYSSQLDAWRETRKTTIESDATLNESQPQSFDVPNPAVEGHARRTDALPGRNRFRLRFQRPLLTLAGLGVFLIVTGVGWFTWRRVHVQSGPATGERIQSLAVLPLENLSGDTEQEYFADGMTAELITELAKIGSLRVISRTSAMRYKRTRKPLAEIARELNVEAVVEGEVLNTYRRVRITAQLIQTATDRHLWAETYERDLRDAVELQGEVAESIARRDQSQSDTEGACTDRWQSPR